MFDVLFSQYRYDDSSKSIESIEGIPIEKWTWSPGEFNDTIPFHAESYNMTDKEIKESIKRLLIETDLSGSNVSIIR